MFQKLEYMRLHFITVHRRIKKQKEMDMVQECGIYPNRIIFIQNKDLNNMKNETKPKWVHPLVRKMRTYRESHPELSESELDDMMLESTLGIWRQHHDNKLNRAEPENHAVRRNRHRINMFRP
jgi:hypothetical protein